VTGAIFPASQPKQRRLVERALGGFTARGAPRTLAHPEQTGNIAPVTVLIPSFKAAFRLTLNIPAHRYVVRRRSERARLLLLAGKLAPSQIALEAGFSHQTHMARWLRRLYGVAPSDLVRRP
jgi:transcriptional regulator GlxA family with amidase domain